MKKYCNIFFSIFFFLLAINITFAQCNISEFIITPTAGNCVQDGRINITIPNASTCTDVTAAIRPVGGVDTHFISITSDGSGAFTNLAPGNYEIRLLHNGITYGPETANVTSTYNPISVQATGVNTTCGATDPLYEDNGKIIIQFNGGTGPFRIDIKQGSTVIQSRNVTSQGTEIFENLAPSSYTASITDLSSNCTSEVSRTVTVSETNWVPLSYSITRRQLTANCETYMRIEVNDGNRTVVRQGGNATYQLEGDPSIYPLTSLSNNTTGVYSFRTQYGLPENKNITFTLTDGCSTLVHETNTRDLSDEFEARELVLLNDSNCITNFSFNYKTWERDVATNTYYWSFSPGRKVSYYAEVPAFSENWVFIEEDTQNGNLNGVGGWTQFQTTYIDTRIKLVFSDSNNCNEYKRIVDGTNALSNNNLNKVVLAEISGVLEGTSTISVNKLGTTNWSGTDSFSYPLTFELSRKDGQENITINPSQPFSLAGTYNIEFPFVKTFETAPQGYWINSRPMFGDLPLGEYELKITDGCGFSITREINLTKPAGYEPTIVNQVGCASSNVVYDMNPNSNTHNLGRVYLHRNQNGTVGDLVAGFNPNQLLEGNFNNIAPGEYFLVFDEINYYPKIITTIKYDSPEYTISVAQNLTGSDQTYIVPITVDPYEELSFNTSTLFCDPMDSNSGIMAISVTGIPVGFIRYSIWSSNSDPNVDAPLETYLTTDLTEMSHVFTDLSAGSYTVRVINECGFTQHIIDLEPGVEQFPDINASSVKICEIGEEFTLSIALPESLFTIQWLDDQGNIVGTGNSITLPATQTTTYTVQYSLNTSLGCPNPATGTDSILIEVGNCYCYIPGATTGTILSTEIGISTIDRNIQNNTDNWPMIRNGGWLVLESNNKGLVLNRIATTTEVENISNPIVGMAVYDVEAGCLKIYTTIDEGQTFEWKCFTTQTCPTQ